MLETNTLVVFQMTPPESTFFGSTLHFRPLQTPLLSFSLPLSLSLSLFPPSFSLLPCLFSFPKSKYLK